MNNLTNKLSQLKIIVRTILTALYLNQKLQKVMSGIHGKLPQSTGRLLFNNLTKT